MKHFTQNLRWLFMSLLLVMGVGSAWADEYTIGWGTASGDNFTNFTTTSGTVSDILSFTSEKNNSGSNPAYNANASELRLYYNSGGNGGSITITPFSGITITGFVMTTSTSPSVAYTVDGGTATSVSANSNTYTVSEISANSSLKIQNVNTTNTQLRIKTIQITYTNSSSKTTTTTTIDASGITNTNLANGTAAGSLTASVKAGGSTVSGASVTWTSSDTDVATVNGGTVTLVGVGQTTITASYAGDDTYAASSDTYDLKVTNISDGVFDFTQGYDYGSGWTANSAGEHTGTWTAINVTLDMAGRNAWNNATQMRLYAASGNVAAGSFTITVPSGKVITAITITGASLGNISSDRGTDGGSATEKTWTGSANSVTYTLTGTERADINIITVTYGDGTSTENADVTFTEASATVIIDNTYRNGITKVPDGLVGTYSSGDTDIATVVSNTGVVTGVAEGTTTITYSWEQQDVNGTLYAAGSTYYTITVTSGASTTSTYTKITSTSDLVSGENYLIVYEDEDGSLIFDGSLTTLDAASNNQSVTIDDNTIETDDAYSFVITGDATNGYTIQSASGIYIGKSADSNGMNENSSTSYTNSITFDEDGNADIIGSGGAYLRFNSTSNQNRFRYYSSTTYTNQKAIQLYICVTYSIDTPVITADGNSVTITCATEGTTIYYTTDGTIPSATNGTAYTGAFNITGDCTVQAIAVKDGETSRVASQAVSYVVPVPVFSPADGSEFSSDYNVTISAESGLTIYYITQDNRIYKTATGTTDTKADSNGSLVSKATVYSSPLTFAQSIMVTAVCMDANGNLSEPVTVNYTYTGLITPPYYSSFSASAGDFTKTSEASSTSYAAPEWGLMRNTGEDAIEKWGEERYYHWVRGSINSAKDSSRTRFYGVAELISPVFDLTGATISNPTFSFIHAGHGWYTDYDESDIGKHTTLETILNDNRINNSCRVYVGESDTNGNVTTWVNITSQVNWFEQLFRMQDGVSADQKTTTSEISRSGDFPRANSGEISLSDYTGKYVRVKFEYTSTSTDYGVWNIDAFTLSAKDVEKITMNSKCWTTYVFDHDIDAYATTQNYTIDGEQTLKIYKVTEFDHSNLTLQQLGAVEEHNDETDDSERYIPARTPVVINGPEGEIDFELYTSDVMLPNVKNNLLLGSLSPNLAVAPVGSGIRYFVMQMKSDETLPYFNKVAEGRSIPDHKAYLNGEDQIDHITSTTNPIKGILVLGEDAATSIFTTDADENTINANGWYTVQGIRIDRPTAPGIYINNGRKVVVK